MKKLLIVLDCEDYILDDLKKFDINEIELYPNTDTIYSYTWEDGFRLLEMPQKKTTEIIVKGNTGELAKAYQDGWNDCINEILGVNENE